jgi:ABC-2 type transport system ATP-binding protein
MIEVHELQKSYGNIKALKGISFKVPRGQIVGFLGPNGAGKTTTMKILTCFMTATSGSVSIDGHDAFASDTCRSPRRSTAI